MDWIQLLGAVGIGAIAAKLLDVLWLQRTIHESEKRKWLRDQRLKAFTSLSKVLLSEGLWYGNVESPSAMELAAEAVLLLPEDNELVGLIEEYIPDVSDTKRRIDRFINNGESTVEERTKMREEEHRRLQAKARLIVKKLGATISRT